MRVLLGANEVKSGRRARRGASVTKDELNRAVASVDARPFDYAHCLAKSVDSREISLIL